MTVAKRLARGLVVRAAKVETHAAKSSTSFL